MKALKILGVLVISYFVLTVPSLKAVEVVDDAELGRIDIIDAQTHRTAKAGTQSIRLSLLSRIPQPIHILPLDGVCQGTTRCKAIVQVMSLDKSAQDPANNVVIYEVDYDGPTLFFPQPENMTINLNEPLGVGTYLITVNIIDTMFERYPPVVYWMASQTIRTGGTQATPYPKKIRQRNLERRSL